MDQNQETSTEKHVNRLDDNQLAKIARDENQTLPGHRDSLHNVDTKVGRQHHRGTGTLDKI
jgi:hypothetical protein